MTLRVVRTCKHGLNFDIEDKDNRTHLRVFQYIEGEVGQAGKVELPSEFDAMEAGKLMLAVAEKLISGELNQIGIGDGKDFEL